LQTKDQLQKQREEEKRKEEEREKQRQEEDAKRAKELAAEEVYCVSVIVPQLFPGFAPASSNIVFRRPMVSVDLTMVCLCRREYDSRSRKRRKKMKNAPLRRSANSKRFNRYARVYTMHVRALCTISQVCPPPQSA
jgi:hypothetical protein